MRRAVLIGGCPRSGTTLLGTLLATEFTSVITPESQFKTDWFRFKSKVSDAWRYVLAHRRFRLWETPVDGSLREASDSIVDVLDKVISLYASRTHQDPDGVWIDHTPNNLRFALRLSALLGTDLKFIHIVRDGRAVANSIAPLDWGPNTPVACGRFWSAHVGIGLAAEAALGQRVLRVRFEDLLRAPNKVLREIGRFAELEARTSGPDLEETPMPNYYLQNYHRLLAGGIVKSRADGWKSNLPPRFVELFEHATADLLAFLDYEPLFGVLARPPRRLEALGLELKELILGELIHPFTYRRKVKRWTP